MEFMPDGEQILKAYLREKYEEGFAEGYAEEYAKGYAEGLAKGKRKRAIADATNLLKEGLPAELIARAIHLPLAEVNALKAQLAQ